MIVWYVPSLIQPSPSVAAETRACSSSGPQLCQFGPCQSVDLDVPCVEQLGQASREPRLAAAARADHDEPGHSRNSPRATTTAEPPTSTSCSERATA